ncbi:hypothetical protein Smp_145770, partial [Schistosoma mansoni]|uniref:hypothetical protein n=1 Tax=Schistosoma mansoni TaxID=6183 RepID=UPI00022C81D2
IHSEYRSKQDVYLTQLENLVAQLPVVNYTLLKHLCQFLHRLSVYQSENKMSIESLGIVFGPNVFRYTPENLGYREQNSINHIMGNLIEHSDSLFRMIAPSCENVTTLNDNLSDNNCARIHHIPFNDTSVQAVRSKKYNTSDSLSNVKSRNNEDDVDTDNLTQSTTKVETNHTLTHITNTCDVPQIGNKASTTPAATATTKANKAVPELAKTNDIVDTTDNHFKRKSSSCDIISTYLEIAIRSCIQEHLFQERLSDFKVYDTIDTVNNFNQSSIGINQISKSDYSDVNVPKTNSVIAAEKLALQKALLYFENLHGRPKEHQDRITMRPLYDRYRSVKRLLNCLQSNNNLNIAEHTEENSDTELQSSVPSIDDPMRRRSILSPNIMPVINDSNIQLKSVHSTGTASNSIASFKSINPVPYSSLQSINRLYNPVSSISDNNLPVPSMMSLPTSASFNTPIYSPITSPQSTLNNNNHVNDRLDVTRKQPTVVTSIPSTIRHNFNPNSTGLFNPNARPAYVDEKQNKNNFAFNKQSFNLDSNVDLKYNELDCDAKRTSDRNSKVPCGNNNEWFGTIGLSKRSQDNAIHNCHVNTFNCHSQFFNETNHHPPVENALSTSTHMSTRLFDSVTRSNRLTSGFSSPIRQENFIGAKAPYFSPPPLSSSFSSPKIMQANISNEVPLSTNTTALMKNRRRLLDTSENAINTMLPNDKYTDSSQAISSSDLSSWSTADLKTALRTLRESKRQLQKTLKDFEHEFIQNTGKLSYL